MEVEIKKLKRPEYVESLVKSEDGYIKLFDLTENQGLLSILSEKFGDTEKTVDLWLSISHIVQNHPKYWEYRKRNSLKAATIAPSYYNALTATNECLVMGEK